MPSDADLVRRARGGDRDAFAALVERHHPTLLRVCRRMVGDSASDAAQDAVVAAMLGLDRLRDDDRFARVVAHASRSTPEGALHARRDAGDRRPPRRRAGTS